MNGVKRIKLHCQRFLLKLNQEPTGILRYSDKANAAEEEWPRRIVTGIQPTGIIHVGNYFGAIHRCVQLQDQGEDLTIFIADLHSLTSYQTAEELRRRTLDTAALLLAAGVRPERAALFAQSAVPRHAELCWLLAAGASLARLQQLPQFRARATAAALCTDTLVMMLAAGVHQGERVQPFEHLRLMLHL